MIAIKTKTQAAAIFGNLTEIAKIFDLTPQAVSHWPEKLDQKRQDQLMGAALRLGLMPCQKPKKRGKA